VPRSERSNPGTRRQAVKLRKASTPAEIKLWAHLRGNKLNGVNFRRQHAIGNFIVDFISTKSKLVIELDGSQHLPSRISEAILWTAVALLAARTVEQGEYDIDRTKYLESQGYKVIRFWNNQVMDDTEGVILVIKCALENRS
jgi:very-short-patch-repair endonuclease